MSERKPIPKKIRFEVFKRDRFTCQYCGRMAPDVILQIDHIKPVAEGGKNEILNLVTACQECNLGKGKTLLTDDSALKMQQKQLLNLAERKEKSDMMIAWKTELMDIVDDQVGVINDLIKRITGGYYLNSQGERDVRRLIRQFSFTEVCDAAEQSFLYYFDDSNEDMVNRTFNEALKKIGGICWNTRKEKEDGFI